MTLPIVYVLVLLVPICFSQKLECGKSGQWTSCNTYSCARDEKLCPKYDYFECPKPLIKCEDTPGICVKDLKDCPNRVSCSGSRVPCWNGICNSTCPEYIECPTFMPYKCPNGECRANLFDCPQPKTCPQGMVKCVDGSCRMDSNECSYAESLLQKAGSLVKCPDGRLMPSLSLCGTQRTCPVGYIKCWNGACAKSVDSCDKLCTETAPYMNRDGSCSLIYNPAAAMCNDSAVPYYCDGLCVSNYKNCYRGIVCGPNSVMCYDGSCRSSYDACPTETLCPVDKPVKCYDGSCSTSIYNCPPISDCPSYAKRCPNGQCVVSTAPCGTGITCTSATPVKCYDNTCRKDSSECPAIPTCPQNRTYLCSDGSCQRSPEQCYPETQCLGYQVKCPDFSCVSSLSECRELKGCPPGMYPCPDKSCRPSFQLCPKDSCPKAMPYMCLDGMCVQEASECNSPSTGCPRRKPLKCSDGSCVTKISECTKKLILSIPDDLFLCPDGSVSDNVDTCYSVYGCPNDFPFMCYDGTCIDLNRQSCAVASCSITLPYRCSDGQCVESKSMCRSFTTKDECPEGLVPCADGRCMEKVEFCRPLMPCGYGFVRCADGSCRRDISMCPISADMLCPKGRPYRCSNGACVDKQTTCMTLNLMSGCPIKKCDDVDGDLLQYFGRCVSSSNDCQIQAISTVIYNGCTKGKPVRCSDGSCVAEYKECSGIVVEVCTSNQFKCDGSKKCTLSNDTCPAGSNCFKNYHGCLASNNCPVDQPFRCGDGTCAAVSFYPFRPAVSTTTYCKPRVICPPTMPYLCDDGSCQSYPQRCSPMSANYRCSNGEPVSKLIECEGRETRCPPLRPILCSTGICVAKVQECVKLEPLCPKETPIRCANGICVSYYGECVPEVYKVPKANSDDRCPDPALPFLCPDGSCATDSASCLAIVNACNDPEKPVKCKTGTCASTLIKCEEENKNMPVCEGKYRLCEDGICRIKCPDYNGCPLTRPVQCPNGYCANKMGECAGISDCPLERPFNCYNGVCVRSFSDCALHPRSAKPQTIMITVDSQQETNADVIINSTGYVLGKLYVPSNTLGYINSTATEPINLVVRQVPDSKLRKYPVPISEEILPYVKEKCQVGYDRLDSLLIIQSPAINITAVNTAAKKVTKLTNYLTLQLYTVVPKGANIQTDFCLGKVDEIALVWKCYSRDLKDVADGRFLYFINEVGSYAVLFSPLNITMEPLWTGLYTTWFVEHPRMAALYILLIFFLFLFISLSLWCVSIQMKEYNRTARELAEYQQAIGGNLADPTSGRVIGSEYDVYDYSRVEGNVNRRVERLERENRKLKEELEQLKTTARDNGNNN